MPNRGRRIGNPVINLLTIFHKNACNGRVLRFSKWRKWHTKAAHRYRRFFISTNNETRLQRIYSTKRNMVL